MIKDSAGGLCPRRPSRAGTVCRDFIGDSTLEPLDGTLRVYCMPGKDSTVKWDGCTANGEFADCPIERQTVAATKGYIWDPDRTCTPKTVQARSCVINGLTNGVQHAVTIGSHPVSVVAINTAGRSRPGTSQLTTVAPAPVAPPKVEQTIS